MRKKALSWLLSVSMVVSLLISVPITASADGSVAGNAAVFDSGINSQIRVSDSDSLDVVNALTVEAWIKPSSGGGEWALIMGKQWNSDDAGPWYSYRLLAASADSDERGFPRKVAFQIAPEGSGETGVESTTVVQNDVWTHVAGVYDGSSVKIYINGVLEGSNPVTGSIRISSLPLYFGKGPWTNNNNYSGMMDEMRVWNVARTAEQISSDMQYVLAGDETGLVGYWNCNEEPGATTIADASGNSNTGTMRNGASLTLSAAPISTPSSSFWTDYTASGFAGGNGSSGTPYQIATAEQLAYLAYLAQSDNAATTDVYYALTADIDLTAHCWTPIAYFKGHFDGGNHTVSGLTIDNSTADYQGLFGRIWEASLSNLRLIDVSIAGGSYTGGLAGYAQRFTVSNCLVSGSLSGVSVVGGFVGDVGNEGPNTFTNCGVSAAINCAGDGIGGLFGYFEGSNTTVTQCFATGSVSGHNDVGGLAGNADQNGGVLTITDCYSGADVTATGGDAGGIIGKVRVFTVNLTSCYQSGTVSGSGASRGIVGDNATTNWSSIQCTNVHYNKTVNAEDGLTGDHIVPGSTYSGKTEAELKAGAFVTVLNNGGSAWTADPGALNGGFPMLAWQLSAPPASYDGEINIETGAGTGSGWRFSGSELIINASGSYRVYGSGVQTSNYIDVDSGITATVVLDNVNMGHFHLLGSDAVTVILKDGTTNTLRGSAYSAALRVPNGTTVTIQGEAAGTGQLTAIGSNGGSVGYGAAGIGGNNNEGAGTIIINGGVIAATGGSDTSGPGAGIGGGGSSGTTLSGGIIAIHGGTVSASGGYQGGYGSLHAPGIGGYEPTNLTVDGGTVTAYGGVYAINATSVAIGPTATVRAFSANLNSPAIMGSAASSGHSAYFLSFSLNTAVSADTGITVARKGSAAETFTLTIPSGYRNFATTVATSDIYTAALTDGSKVIAAVSDDSTEFNGVLQTPSSSFSNYYAKLMVVPPSATSVGITGTASVGQTLNGSYTYNAGSVSTEGSTDFRWLRVSGIPSLLGQPYLLYTTNNIDGVGSAPSGPTNPTQFMVTGQTHITKISNYHYGHGYVSGTISLVDANDTVYGPWDTVNEGGYWCAYPNVGVQAGTYTVIDSQPGSWSFNSSSGNAGMTEIIGYTVIAGATSQTYTIQAADAGHRILFEVTPEDAGGNRGPAVLSAAFGPVEASASVARIGTTPYPSLDDALTNATGGDTITLLADISYSNAIDASTKNITIDLNGFDLSVQNVGSHALYAANGYALTILDANDKGGALSVASIGAGKSAAYAGSGGDILLEGTLSAAYPGGLDNQGIFGAYADGIGSTIHITGDATGYTAGIYAQNSAAITVVGDVSGSYYGAYAAYNGSVDVTGDVTGSYALTPEYGGIATVQGDVTGSSFAIFIRNQAGWNAPRAEVTGNVIGTAGGAISAGDAADIDITGDVTGYVVVSGSEATCPVVTVNGDITVSGGFGVSVFYGGTVTVNGRILGASPYLKLNNLDISQGDFEISGDYFKYSNQTVDTPAPYASNTVYVTKANQAPVITSNWNYTTVYFGKDYAYTLTVTDAENTAGTKIYSSLDSAPYSIAWAYPGAPGTQHMTLSPLKGVLAAGSHTLRYYAQDTGGAVSSTLTLTFTVTDEPTSTGGGGGGTPADTGTKITVSTTDGSSSVEGTLTQTNGGSQVVIKNDAFDKVDAANKPVSVDAQLATVTFDKKAMDTIGAASGAGDVTITARQVPGSELSDRDRALVGSRPVYDLTITSGGKIISNFNGGHATVIIPYTLLPDENPHAIVVWYLSDSGKLVGLRGHYDAAAKTVVFITPHFSNFVVGYNLVTFSDAASGAWYHDAVTFLAARGVTTGTTATTFSPDATLTRGQFLVMLLRAYGIEPDSNTADNFSDAGNTYYTGYLAAAKRLGIANGVGNNMFAPDKSITRQEMFTLLYNALKEIDELPTNTSGKTLSDFSDVSGIASWAKDAMTLLVESGTISGSGGKLNPTGTTTRAEMAQVLYNLLTVE